ncbi:hypothetical protein ACK1KB_12965 [Chryseobacterium sp. TY3]
MENLARWTKNTCIVYIDTTADRQDNNLSVIAVLQHKPLELFRENISVVDSTL